MNTLAQFRPELSPERGSVNRLILGDYICQTEIGAFGEERGVEQTLRFNVTVETALPGGNDDVDAIVSYDTLIQTIDRVLRDERLELLETLADRIADHLLTLPAVLHVRLRVEKLDRGPFALGVEIERATSGVTPLPQRPDQSPVVAMVPDTPLDGAALIRALDDLLSHGRPVVLTACAATAPALAANADAQRQVDLLAMEQAAWALAARDARACVVDSRTELQHAIDNGLLAIWAPSRMVRRARDGAVRDTLSGLALTSWFARELGADSIHHIDPDGQPGPALALTDE